MSKPETERFYARPETIRHVLDVSKDTLAEWEKSGKIVENIHFVRLGRDRRYCMTLMRDRLANFNDDAAHQDAIDNWLASLPSNQKPNRKMSIVG